MSGSGAPSAGCIPPELLHGSNEIARRAERIVRRFVSEAEVGAGESDDMVSRLTWAIAALESYRGERERDATG